MANPRLCSISECDNPHKGHGLCNMHLIRLHKHGTPYPRKNASEIWVEELFKSPTDECVQWPFHRNNRGYGQIGVDRKVISAHRFICQKQNGAPPTPEYHAAHLCGKGSDGCVNPRHLKWKTASENEADKFEHGTRARGEDAKQAKLTAADVAVIRLSSDRICDIVRKYPFVSRSTIVDIIRHRTWKHL